MSAFRVYLLFLVGFCGTCRFASAANAARGREVDTLATNKFYCADGYDRQECEQHITELKTVLVHYSAGVSRNWNWVIVPSEDWHPLLQRLRLDQRSPAFTALVERETFLQDALFFSQPMRTDELVRNFHVPFDQLLSLAVRHELGHAICNGGDEEIANRVAEQLRTGKHPDCGANVKSLTRIQELYLHSQSPGFPRVR
jgi:hypothetical protein